MTDTFLWKIGCNWDVTVITWIPNVFLLSMCPTFVQKGLYLIDSVSCICVEMNGKEKWPKSDIFLLCNPDLISFAFLVTAGSNQTRATIICGPQITNQIHIWCLQCNFCLNGHVAFFPTFTAMKCDRPQNSPAEQKLPGNITRCYEGNHWLYTSMDGASCLKSALCPLTSGGRQKWLQKY